MSFLEREVLFLVFALKLRFMLAQRYNSLPVWEHFQSKKHGLNILSRSDSYFFRVPKDACRDAVLHKNSMDVVGLQIQV